MKFNIGDRIELAHCNIHGTIEYVDDDYIRVLWDDNKIGLLYFNNKMVPNANKAIKLVGMSK